MCPGGLVLRAPRCAAAPHPHATLGPRAALPHPRQAWCRLPWGLAQRPGQQMWGGGGAEPLFPAQKGAAAFPLASRCGQGPRAPRRHSVMWGLGGVEGSAKMPPPVRC